jgi:putative FmdB family regulatory protein
MPTYDYVCQHCGRSFELRLSMAQYSESKTPRCPQCASPSVTRPFAPVNVVTGSRSGGGPAPSCDPAGGSCCCG